MKNYKSLPVDDLNVYPGNSRVHSDEQIYQIAKSIQNFGFTSPILIDENNMILAGHARLQAAKFMQLKEVPTLKIEGLSGENKRAYIIADNKIALNSDWDKDLLKKELNFLIDIDFDVSITGFNGIELEDLFSEEMDIDPKQEDDELPETSENPITKSGDLWILGNHRLLCGSSTIQDNYDRLVCDLNPRLMVTDPPYGVEYEANWRAIAKNRKKTDREINSSLMNDENADWYDAYVLFRGSIAYVWHASSFTDIVMDGLRRAGFEIKQQIIWNKNVHALSRSDYHRKHEPCWYAVKDGDREWYGGRDKMTVWDIPNVMYEKDKTAHPTQKPVEIYARSILNHTKKNEYVYDPFAGSGTLMAACEKTQRRALMIELDPKYCDVIIKRYESFTGQKARLSTMENYSAHELQVD